MTTSSPPPAVTAPPSVSDAHGHARGRHEPLREGATFWRCEGPAEGTPVVLVHGATVSSWAFDPLVPLLATAGFRALRFDLYGHGQSDYPEGDYSLDRFVRQTCELIEATDSPRPALLLGHSFGAAVAAATALAHPEWVKRLVLVAPMLDFNATNGWSRIFRVTAAGEVLMRMVGVPALVRRRRKRYASIGLQRLTPLFVEQASRAGFGRALLSMIRMEALGDQSARYSALRDLALDILVITGSRDAVIPRAHIDRVRALLPPHRHCDVAGAEHNLLLTHPEAVVAALLERVTPS